MRSGWLLILALGVTGWLPGCRLPGGEGPVSRSLVASRQFSQQGIAAMERGQWQQAEKLLAQGVKACAADPDARRNYAEALWHRGAREEAIAQIEQASRLVTEDASLQVRIAEMRLAMGQMDRALQSAERAIDLDPKLSTAWAIRGRVMRAKGQTRQALADDHRALGYAPDDRSLQWEIAELYRELNEPQRALAALQGLADSYAPGEESQQVLYMLGLTYRALGRYGDAVESFSAASVRGQPMAEVYYRLGEAQWLAGDPGQAAAAARQALALDPDHQPSGELLGRVELGLQPNGTVQR